MPQASRSAVLPGSLVCCYTPQPSRGGAVPCRRHRAVRCCLGRYSLLLATRLSHHTWRGYAVPQASRNAVLAGSLYSLLCYTPQPSSGGAMCRATGVAQCGAAWVTIVLCYGGLATAMVLPGGSVVHGGPIRWVRCTRWPYTMGPLYTVALYTMGPLYTVALYTMGPLYTVALTIRWVRCIHGGPIRWVRCTRWPPPCARADSPDRGQRAG